MPTFDIRVPQLGEGLVEVRIVRFLKAPGDTVARDEPIYAMETDKAEVEIESPIDGVLERWCAAEDDVVPVGAVVGTMNVASICDEQAQDTAPDAGAAEDEAQVRGPDGLTNAAISPRARAYARAKGIAPEALPRIPAATGRLVPGDIDRYLRMLNTEPPAAPGEPEFDRVPMSARQRTLFYRLSSGAAQVVSATLEEPFPFEPIERIHAWYEKQALPADAQPSKFLLMAYCVAQAMTRSASFRSVIVDVNTLHVYRHANLGIAVALPHDELTTAVLPRADTLSFADFVAAAKARIREAREGMDQASQTVINLSLTGMAAFGVRTAVPVVVPPSVATLFIGSPYDAAEPGPAGEVLFRRTVHLVLAFDHRIINGVGAASFVSEIKRRVLALPEELLPRG